MHPLLGALILLAGLIAFGILTAVAIAATRRGRHGSSGALGAAMVEVESLLDPAKRHTARVIRADDAAEADGLGDPPRAD